MLRFLTAALPQIRYFHWGREVELNLIGRVWNLRIGTHQVALWRNSAPIINFVRARSTILAVMLVALASLTACSTAQVQSACESAESALQKAAPFLSAAPPYVTAAVGLLGAGAYACGTPEYAAARGVVVAWLAQRGVKAN